jgi:hypothetical protein
MPGRREYKYLVPICRLDRLRADIQPYVETDCHAAKRDGLQYTVRSIYYDTPHLELYRDKIEGTQARMKLRIRAYEEEQPDSVVFLEVKRKDGEFIYKHRAPLLQTHVAQFLTSHDVDRHIITALGDGNAKADARRFLFHYCGRSLRPTLLVIYEREAYTSRFDPRLRITLDKNLRSTPFPSLDMLYDEAQSRCVLRGSCILELKFCASLPAWVHRAVERFGLQRSAVSKYTVCLDSQRRCVRSAPAAILASAGREIARSRRGGSHLRAGLEVPSAA